MKIDAEIISIRLHGRGGQGAVTSAELLAQAAISEGKYAQAFPSFGPERRGAPVQAFVRISSKPIRVRAEITEPDIIVVLDPGLLAIANLTSGLKESGMIVINSKDITTVPSDIKKKWTVAITDANLIARETLGCRL
jgi:pyruvate ferredoxin oxidoreductase gamma subunit